MKIVGHRGAKGLAPENTIVSLLKAIEHHVDEVELDLRITGDGVVILHHDPEVIDAAGNRLVIAKTNLDTLKQHKPDLATFEEAVSAINRRVPIIVEVKTDVSAQPVVAVVKTFMERGWQDDDFRFSSYDQSVLLALHHKLPKIPTIVIENWSTSRARRRMKELGTNRVSMLEYWLWGGYIRAISRAGYEIYSFPPKKNRWWAKLLLPEHTNVPNRARKWAKAGLSGVITDFPDRFEPKKATLARQQTTKQD